MAARVWQIWCLLFIVFRRLTSSEPISSSSSPVCRVVSPTDSIVRSRGMDANKCLSDGSFLKAAAEGGELSLQRALNPVDGNNQEYVSVLFYASWCPFSRNCRAAFTILASLYPSIRHFTVEESAVKPSTLSKYRVHGFPTLFLINSTTQVRYHGSRTISSLATFYADVTGMKPITLDRMSLENIKNPSNLVKLKDDESYPYYSWARFPENLLQQESYLLLATTFVLLRLSHSLLPMLLASVHSAWRRHVQSASLLKWWEHPLTYLSRAVKVSKALREPCKRSNLQEGALNARDWASKSLASVSIGDASTSWGTKGNESPLPFLR